MIRSLSELVAPVGSRHKKKRVGRGHGSGHGGYSTRGVKGQKARTGRKKFYAGFEGGQMPLHRRLPKRGFKSKKIEYNILNISQLNKLPPDTIISPELLYKEKLIKKKKNPIKILGNGEVKRSYQIKIKVHKITLSAKKKIEAAGGQVEIIRNNK